MFKDSRQDSTGRPPDDSVPEPARTDLVLSALAAATRRHVLRYFLQSSERTATLDDLTRYVAKQLDDHSRRHVRLHLHHVHLPKLERAGLVQYNFRTSTVRYRERRFAEEIVEKCG